MGYLEKNLNDKEKIIAKAKFSWRAIIKSVIWLSICIAFYFYLSFHIGGLEEQMDLVSSKNPFIANDEIIGYMGVIKALEIVQYIVLTIGILPSLFQIINIKMSVLAITDRRVIGKTGIIRVVALDMPLSKVDNISLNTQFWGRILGYSTIEVKSASGAWGFKYIAHANEFKNSVTEALEEAEQRARLEQAQAMADAMKK